MAVEIAPRRPGPVPARADEGALVVTDEVWDTIARRDRSAGFVFAVRTTGIYCHPWCPARRPHRHNAVAFPDGRIAEGAGFRPCRRCRPDLGGAHPHADLVTRVRAALDADDPPRTLAALAERVGGSPSHLHRTFRTATGLTPREYLAARRLAALEDALSTAGSVVDAGFDAGYGSARGLYEEAGALGLAPSVWRGGGAGARLRITTVDTPLGPVAAASSELGLVALEFGDAAVLGERLATRLPEAEVVDDPDPRLADAIAASFDGSDQLVELPLDVRATAFRRRVWQAVRCIPRGQTRTYREIAEAVGQPAAVRAVGAACAANPVGLAVPCHRVVRTDGTLAGYRWGVDRKEALLALEGG